jgi:hypothetical protein
LLLPLFDGGKQVVDAYKCQRNWRMSILSHCGNTITTNEDIYKQWHQKLWLLE